MTSASNLVEMAPGPIVIIGNPFGGTDTVDCDEGLTVSEIIDLYADRIGWARDQLVIYYNGEELAADARETTKVLGGDHLLITAPPRYQVLYYLWSYIYGAFSSWNVSAVGAIKYGMLAYSIGSSIAGFFSGGGSRATYSISGASNQARPDTVCPMVVGKRRVVPPLAASTVTQTIDDETYLLMLVQWHVGPCQVSDIRIGETPIETFKDVQVQHRLRSGDVWPSLYPSCIREDTFGQLKLTKDGGWVQRQTQTDTTKIGVVVAAPSGLAWNGKDEALVRFRIQYRAIDSGVWIDAPVGSGGEIEWRETHPAPFQRAIEWTVPKGQYDVQILRTWADAHDNYPRLQDQIYWVSLRSYGDGLPVTDPDVALSVIRIRATNQLNGQIDNLNGIVEPLIPKWDGTQFSGLGTSRNPGEQVYWLATGKQNAQPLTNRINVANIGAFAAKCAARNWKCDYVFDADVSVEQAIELVARAGKALGVGWEEGKLSIVVDDERPYPVQVFSGRNVRNFTGTIAFTDKLHAVSVTFYDEASQYQRETRTVYADGYDASNATLIEAIDEPTKTDAAEVHVAGWRALYGPRLRPETYEFDTDLTGIVVRWGQRADIAHSRMAVGIRGTRIMELITNSSGQVTGFVIDETVTMKAGTSYVLKAQRGSVVTLFDIVTVPGSTNTLNLLTPVAAAAAPFPGNHGVFGIKGSETLPCILVGRETASDKTSHLTFIPYAPDLLSDGGTPPPWNPKITSRSLSNPIATGYVDDTTRRNIIDEVIARMQNDPVPDGSVDDTKLANGAVSYPSLSAFQQQMQDWVTGGLVTALDDLKKLSKAVTEGLLSGAYDVQAIRQTVASNYGSAKAYADQQITAATGPGSAIAQSITTLTSGLSGANSAISSNASAISSLTTRVTSAEGNISTLTGQYISLSSTVAGKADSSALTSIATRVTTAEGNISTLSGQYTSLSAAVAGKADASALSALSSTVSNYGSAITANTDAITSLSGLVGNSSSSSVMRLGTATTPEDASARFAVDLKVGSGSSEKHAYIYADATTSSKSRIMFGADIVGVSSNQFVYYKSNGTPVAMFSGDGLNISDLTIDGSINGSKMSSTAFITQMLYKTKSWDNTGPWDCPGQGTTAYFFENELGWYGDSAEKRGVTVEIHVDGTVERSGGATGKVEIWFENQCSPNHYSWYVLDGLGSSVTSTSYDSTSINPLKFEFDGTLLTTFSFTTAIKSKNASGKIRLGMKSDNASLRMRYAVVSMKVFNAY